MKTKQIKKPSEKIFRHQLALAFRELRKHGYFAKQSFWCCSTCGWSAIPLFQKKETGKVVFVNCGMMDSIREWGALYLQWKGDGKLIVQVLRKYGFHTVGRGTPNSENAIHIYRSSSAVRWRKLKKQKINNQKN